MEQKKGILLANLGTPDKPEKKEVRAFLKAFLADKRVIDMPRILWLPILYGIILNVRPKKSAKLYQEIWQPEGSPLLIYTREQTKQLQERFPDKIVKFGMSYSHPSIPTALAEMAQAGITDITIIPLYPQYSTTTTASIYDTVAKYYLKKANIPTIYFIRDFATHPLYIQLLVNQIKAELALHSVEHLLFSYHGIPVSYVTKGDPYLEQCRATTKAVMEKLDIELTYSEAYQSKFGPAEWLTPATDATLKALPKEKGIKKVLVITPGFVSDCLETIEEIKSENRGYFLENGGTEFYYVHPFNDDSRFVELLADLVEEQ